MNLLNWKPSELEIAAMLAVGIAMLTFAAFYRRRAEAGPGSISTPARVCLVLLRIAIGWHFLVEGLDKLHTPNWSSEGYLRESSGPLAPTFRNLAGDSLVLQLTTDGTSVSPELADEWQRYVEAYVDYYGLDQAAQAKAAKILEEAKREAIVVVDPKTKAESKGWLVAAKPMKKKVGVEWSDAANAPKPLDPPQAENKVDMTIADRLKEYEHLKADVAKAESDLPSQGRKAWPAYMAAKTEAAKWRTELKKEVDQATADIKAKLDKLLSMEQHHLTKALEETNAKKIEPAQRSMDWGNQRDRADAVVKWGLIVAGVCLILGAFTRLAAIFGAVLLLMFFLAMPPLPYLPESPKAEGHYVYINKNIIEMLALLALAALPTGRWAGLDGVLQFANPFNWSWRKTAADEKAAAKEK